MKRLSDRLLEGDGQPGFDLPPDGGAMTPDEELQILREFFKDNCEPQSVHEGWCIDGPGEYRDAQKLEQAIRTDPYLRLMVHMQLVPDDWADEVVASAVGALEQHKSNGYL